VIRRHVRTGDIQRLQSATYRFDDGKHAVDLVAY
jgi:hypothetical protein